MKFFYVFHDEQWIPILKNQVPQCKLLYVGQKNLKKKYEDVYVCKDMKKNIEEYPQFLSFTAWYAISKNTIEEEDNLEESIAIFEYDCAPKSKESILNLEQDSKMFDIVGTSKLSTYFYTDVEKNVLDSVIEKLNLCVPQNLIWFPSTNFVIKRKILNEFVDLYWPFALQLNTLDPENVKYYHERVFSAFLAQKIKDFHIKTCVSTAFKHFQAGSHNISGFFNCKKLNCTFVTYGDDKFRHSVSRISREMQFVCEDHLIYNERDIDDTFKIKSNIDWTSSRGGGFWLWKPYILHKALHSIKDNHCIFYCDSGCCVEDAIVLQKNIELFIESDKEIYAFQMRDSDRNELQWTSQKVLDKFNLRACDLNVGQVHATAFLLKNTLAVKSIVKKWIDLATNEPLLFTDEYTDQGRHRHDQSIWSCLLKTSVDKKKFFLAKDCIESEKNSFGLFKAHAHGNESCAISYALKYRDLKKAFNFSKEDLENHYKLHGKKQGRTYCNCFRDLSFSGATIS